MGRRLRLRLHSTQNDIRDEMKASRTSTRPISTTSRPTHTHDSHHGEDKGKSSEKSVDVHLLKENVVLQRKAKNKVFGMLLQQLSDAATRDLKRRLLAYSLNVFLEKLEEKADLSEAVTSNGHETAQPADTHAMRLDILPSFKKKAGTQTGGYRPTRQMHISKTGDSIEHHQLKATNVRASLHTRKSRSSSVASDFPEDDEDYTSTEEEEDTDWSIEDDEFLEDHQFTPTSKEREIVVSRKRSRKIDKATISTCHDLPEADIDVSIDLVDSEEVHLKRRRQEASRKTDVVHHLTSEIADISTDLSRQTLVWRKRRPRPLMIFDVDIAYLQGELDDEDKRLMKQLEKQNELDAQETASTETVTGRPDMTLVYGSIFLSIHFFFDQFMAPMER